MSVLRKVSCETYRGDQSMFFIVGTKKGSIRRKSLFELQQPARECKMGLSAGVEPPVEELTQVTDQPANMRHIVTNLTNSSTTS